MQTQEVLDSSKPRASESRIARTLVPTLGKEARMSTSRKAGAEVGLAGSESTRVETGSAV